MDPQSLAATVPASSPSSHARRILQLSLRTLFLLLTAGCIWLGVITKRARDQRAAVNRVLELGGSVSFDYEFDKSGKRIKDAQPPGWRWLRQRIGDEYFREVRRVMLDRTSATDDDLRLIGKLRATKTLSLNFTNVGDSGLAHVRHLRILEYLGLAETRVTDKGIRCLENMDQLDSLILGYTDVGNEAVSSIIKLKRLQFVNLQSTRVTSDGVKELSRLPKLTGLCLSETAVDDAVAGSIGEKKSLTELTLTGTKISGEGLLRLRDALPSCRIDGESADLGTVRFDKDPQIATRWVNIAQRLASLNKERRLKLIDLSGSQITDEFLTDLHELDSVEAIDLRDTQVTDEGVRALHQALPKCEVVR